MKQFIYIICIVLLFISCGTQQQTMENTTKKTPPKINTAIIDSVNAQFDKISENDTLNTTRYKKVESKKIADTKELTTKPAISKEKKRSLFRHNTWHKLLQKHVTKDGNVNYKGFKKERIQLRNYIISLGKNMPNNDWSNKEILAYWINAYNAFTVDLILRNYPVKSIKDIKNPWNQRLWKLGNKWYNLDEIEHKILRKMNEPRIHFAINCASFSCPPLLNEAFTHENLEQQLTQVTKTFLADSQRNTITKNQLNISKIFKWFSKDFKQHGSLIDFLNKYSAVKINANAKKSYKEYNWNLNE